MKQTPVPISDSIFQTAETLTVIASEAKQSIIGAANRKLDCFVAALLAMTSNTPSHSRGAMRPSDVGQFRP
jgi:hypothetical protein